MISRSPGQWAISRARLEARYTAAWKTSTAACRAQLATRKDRADPAANVAAVSTPALLGLDLGTSGAKAAVVDHDSGAVRHSAFRAYPTRTAPGGGSEQRPADWLRAARAVVSECAAAHGPVSALALTGQMQDLISLDERGEGLGDAVLYNDTRAHAEAARLAHDLPEWNELTGNIQNATSTAAMFRRLRELADPRAEQAATLLFSPAGYVAHRLGLGPVVDLTTAATTGLLELSSRTWTPAVCAAAGIDPALLPSIRDGYVGDTGAHARELLGLSAGVPVVLAPGDAAATTAGIVGTAPGDDYLYLGSSGWHAQVRHGDVRQAPGTVHQLALADGRLLQISAVLSAAGTADWARETFLDGLPAAAADQLLQERGTRGFSGVLSLPSLKGERFPVRDEHLGAALVGMNALTTPVDLYSAVLEGVALGLSHAMDRDSSAPLAVVGGGASSRPWLRIIADVTGREVRAVPGADAALHGAVLTAARSLGLTAPGVSPLRHQPAARIAPDRAAHESYRGIRGRHRELYDLLGSR